MERDGNFPAPRRRDQEEEAFAADEVIVENDPLSEGLEAQGIDEVVREAWPAWRRPPAES